MICKLLSHITGREARRLRARICALVVEHNARLGELKRKHEEEVSKLYWEVARSNQAAVAWRAEAEVCRQLAEEKGALLPRGKT